MNKNKILRNVFLAILFMMFLNPLISVSKNISNPVFQEFSKTYSKSCRGSKENLKSNSIIWEESNVIPFNELIVSWNAHRPKQGCYVFYVSVFNKGWSPWKKLAEWGSDYQRTFGSDESFGAKVSYSRTTIKNGFKPCRFRVKAVALNGASILGVHKIYACLSDWNKFKIFKRCQSFDTVKLVDVPLQSQRVLNHERTHDICSPTSVGIAVSYLSSRMGLKNEFCKDLSNKIVEFSKKVHDDGVLQIYGNWMLNTAQVYDSTNCRIFSRVERLNDFVDVYKYLKNNIPVVVSIRGIKGGATPYANGHLLVVVGWDKEKQEICCIDPAFSANEATKINYNIDEFLSAWGRSRNLSYVFFPKA